MRTLAAALSKWNPLTAGERQKKRDRQRWIYRERKEKKKEELLPLPVSVIQVVRTLAAALSRWNPLTALIASTSSVNTYSSPPICILYV